MVVTISHSGYIKRTPVSMYQAQKRGGKGNKGMEARDDDFLTQLFIASTPQLRVLLHEPRQVVREEGLRGATGSAQRKGRAIINFIELEAEEKIAAITPVMAVEAGKFVTTITRGGQIKKTELLEYENFRDKGIIGVKIADDDQLLTAIVTDGSGEFFVATKQGQSIRFDEDQVRATGRNTGGVKAIELEDTDQVVGLARTEAERTFVLTVCERGYGKRTPIDEFKVQNRGGKGIILIDASDRNGPVVGIAMVKPEDEVMIITDRGQTIRTPIEGIRETGRNAQGVKLMRIDEDERIVAIEPINEGTNDVALEGQEGQADEGSEDGTPATEGGETLPTTSSDGSEGADGADGADGDGGEQET